CGSAVVVRSAFYVAGRSTTTRNHAPDHTRSKPDRPQKAEDMRRAIMPSRLNSILWPVTCDGQAMWIKLSADDRLQGWLIASWKLAPHFEPPHLFENAANRSLPVCISVGKNVMTLTLSTGRTRTPSGCSGANLASEMAAPRPIGARTISV